MQKLNLNNIPEAPENKDFWVVGTANREGSIDSNSYKKNLANIGKDSGGEANIDEKELIRHTISTYDPLRRVIFSEDLVYLGEQVPEVLPGNYFCIYGVKDSADLESLTKMPIKEDNGENENGTLIMFNSSVSVDFKALNQLIETALDKIPFEEKPTYTILKDTLKYSPIESAGDTSAKAWDLSNFVSVTGVSSSTMILEEFPDAMRESAPFPIPDEVHYFLQIQLETASS